MVILFQRKRSLATFGAAIVVLLLVFDPFVQQITKYPTQSAPISDGTGVAVTKRLKHFVPDVTLIQWNLAYAWGIWSEDNLFQANCPSGNCTWPVFRSIGVCSKCADITTSLALNCHKEPRENETYWKHVDYQKQACTFNASCHIIPPLGQSTVINSTFIISFTRSPISGIGLNHCSSRRT